MAESTEESNADTLREELNAIMPAIFPDGGSKNGGDTDGDFGVLKAIDDAIGILTSLRKVESKKVPKEFICELSHTIMTDPVVIASGQTFEKRYIAEHLKNDIKCPKTKEVLSHSALTPNLLANELISQWCRLNKFDRPEPSEEKAIKLHTHDIGPLLQRISSPLSDTDQLEAAEELRERTRKFPHVRDFFVAELKDSVTDLISPLSEPVDSNPKLHEHITATLCNISAAPDKNKTVMIENPLVIPLLTKSLTQGTPEARRNSAAALMSLAILDSNKIILGNSGAIEALVELIKEGDYLGTKNAAAAVHIICLKRENSEKAVLAGLVPAVINKIEKGSNAADELVAVLALVSTHKHATVEMEKLGFIQRLFEILRKSIRHANCENAVSTVWNMCDKNRSGNILNVVREEEEQHRTFSTLEREGTGRSKRKAELVLNAINKNKVAGKEGTKRRR